MFSLTHLTFFTLKQGEEWSSFPSVCARYNRIATEAYEDKEDQNYCKETSYVFRFGVSNIQAVSQTTKNAKKLIVLEKN